MTMAVCYKKLWHILLDRDMMKKDLQEAAGLTSYAMHKLSRDEDVTTETLEKICMALDCTIDEVIEFVSDKDIHNK
jgi:DNA-binding Xre family transcriptional regulator